MILYGKCDKRFSFVKVPCLSIAFISHPANLIALMVDEGLFSCFPHVLKLTFNVGNKHVTLKINLDIVLKM